MLRDTVECLGVARTERFADFSISPVVVFSVRLTMR
jgi:hypothetical protein